MLKTLFQPKKRLDIDHLIFEIVENKNPADYEAFCQLITERVFFVRIDAESAKQLPKGVPYRVQPMDNVKLTGLANVQGLKLLPLCTSSADKRLQGSYAEIEGLEALRMATKSAGIDGVLFQNNAQSWLVLKAGQIRQILDKHERR